MKIRPMTIEDYPSVYALWLVCPGMGLNQIDDSYIGVRRFLLRNPESSFVCELSGEIIGAILSGNDGRRGYIYHACVHPAYQRQRIGKALVEAAMNALYMQDIHKIALVVFSRNDNGNAFWERLGFTCREDLIYRNKALTELPPAH